MRDLEVYSLHGLSNVLAFELKGRDFDESFMEREFSSLRYGCPMLFVCVNWDITKDNIAFLPLSAYLDINSNLIATENKSFSKYVRIPRLNFDNTISFVKVRWGERHLWYTSLKCPNSEGKFFMGIDADSRQLTLNLVVEDGVYLEFEMKCSTYSKRGLPKSFKIIPKRYINKKLKKEELEFFEEKKLDLEEDETLIIQNMQANVADFQVYDDCDFFINQ